METSRMFMFVAALAFAGLLAGCPDRAQVGAEICGNGEDDDGDGEVDEGCQVEPDAGPEEDGGAGDEDGDGFDLCKEDEDPVDDECDCDDDNADIHPQESETSCTERTDLDEDCDGLVNCDDPDCAGRGECPGVVCEDDEDCEDDDVVCTDEDCQDGECRFSQMDSRCDDAEVCDPDDPDADNDTGCVERCEDDSDCENDEVCDGGECVEVECTRDSDCDDGFDCTRDDCVRNDCVFEPDNDLCGNNEVCNPDDSDADVDGCVEQCECDSDSDCDDSDFCNGEEQCDGCDCQEGEEPDCDDSVACTEDSCSEALDRCRNISDHDFCQDRGDNLCVPDDPDADVAGCVSLECENDADCSDGQYCNGSEWCDGDSECRAGTTVVCNDGNAGTSDACDEATDRCVYTPIQEVCGNGLDDDNDGVVDDGCAEELCTDIVDNDGDGQINEGCAEICGDGIDNDRDGLTDEGCGGACNQPNTVYLQAASGAVGNHTHYSDLESADAFCGAGWNGLTDDAAPYEWTQTASNGLHTINVRGTDGNYYVHIPDGVAGHACAVRAGWTVTVRIAGVDRAVAAYDANRTSIAANNAVLAHEEGGWCNIIACLGGSSCELDCDNGADDDGDGLTDCNDVDCDQNRVYRPAGLCP